MSPAGEPRKQIITRKRPTLYGRGRMLHAPDSPGNAWYCNRLGWAFPATRCVAEPGKPALLPGLTTIFFFFFLSFFGTRPERTSRPWPPTPARLPPQSARKGGTVGKSVRARDRYRTSGSLNSIPPSFPGKKEPKLRRFSINPCGNFSLTSSMGWHPLLRIVKPQFLASHYY